MTVTMPKRKTALALAVATALATASLVLSAPAVATATEDVPAICVPAEAYVEIIPAVPGTPAVPEVPATPGSPEIPAVPAVYETVVIPAVYETVVVQEARAEVWANFSPNRQQGPFDGPPSYPHDDRGTWQVHDKIPGGHVGPDGVYQQSNGNGRADWFYRQAGVPEITEERLVTPETTGEVLVSEAIPAVPAVPGTPGTPAIPAVPGTPEIVIEHPEVVCPVDPGPQPEDTVVEASSKSWSTPECGDTEWTVTTTTTTQTTPWILVDNVWVEGETVENTTVTETTETIPEDMQTTCPVETEEPPVVVTPPTETPEPPVNTTEPTEPTETPTPTVTAPAPTQTDDAVMTALPRTGGGADGLLFAMGGGALLLLGAGLLARNRWTKA